jgi:hypothetical protein
MSNQIKYFRSWNGLCSFLQQTGLHDSLASQLQQQESLPLLQRSITVQYNGQTIDCKIFYDLEGFI